MLYAVHSKPVCNYVSEWIISGVGENDTYYIRWNPNFTHCSTNIIVNCILVNLILIVNNIYNECVLIRHAVCIRWTFWHERKNNIFQLL